MKKISLRRIGCIFGVLLLVVTLFSISAFALERKETLAQDSNKNVDIKFGGKQPDQDDADIKVGSFEYLGGSAINSVSFISNSGTIKVRQIGDE